MKILGLISSPLDPASRARILQYKPYIKRYDSLLSCNFYFPLRDSDPPKWAYYVKRILGINEWRSANFLKSIGRIPLLINQNGFDLIWQNRLMQLHHIFWEKRLRKPVAFDFDDAIWINEGENQVKEKIKRSQIIFAGNNYLAEYASKFNANVKVVPTTIDTETITPLFKKNNYYTIGWIGTNRNQQEIEPIKKYLISFLEKNADARLVIVSDIPVKNIPFDQKRIIFHKWSIEKENEILNEFTVGIMPLIDNEWNRGKCSYKMLQYMACGKPVIVSPVGKNSQLLEESTIGFKALSEFEWMNALRVLKEDYDLYQTFSTNAINLIKEKYSAAVWTPIILEYLNEII